MPKGVYPHTHIKKKEYDPILVESIRHLYEDKVMTKIEVANELGIGKNIVQRVMIRHGIKARKAVKRNQYGSANNSWKGNAATYSALHYRVYKSKIKTGICTSCDKECRTEWANLTGDYTNINDYYEMCRKCHRQHDFKWALANGKWMSHHVPRKLLEG